MFWKTYSSMTSVIFGMHHSSDHWMSWLAQEYIQSS